jgi:hypothetical protein
MSEAAVPFMLRSEELERSVQKD